LLALRLLEWWAPNVEEVKSCRKAAAKWTPSRRRNVTIRILLVEALAVVRALPTEQLSKLDSVVPVRAAEAAVLTRRGAVLESNRIAVGAVAQGENDFNLLTRIS
jgi:hypothetical protein